MASILDVDDYRTQWGSGHYLVARIGFLVAYAAAAPFLRSMIWNVATVGILVILWAIWRP